MSPAFTPSSLSESGRNALIGIMYARALGWSARTAQNTRFGHNPGDPADGQVVDHIGGYFADCGVDH
jgi:hypothetical protein